LKPNGIEVCAVKAPPIFNEPVPVLLDQPGVKPTDPGLPEHEVILGSAPHGKLRRERLDGSVRNEELCLTFHVCHSFPASLLRIRNRREA
jgi:hypothetical protein